jgi:hypothetical protein
VRVVGNSRLDPLLPAIAEALPVEPHALFDGRPNAALLAGAEQHEITVATTNLRVSGEGMAALGARLLALADDGLARGA